MRHDALRDRAGKGRKRQRVILDIEDQHHFRFLVGEPRSGLERYPGRKAPRERPVDQVVDFLGVVAGRDLKGNLIEIERHRSLPPWRLAIELWPLYTNSARGC